MGLFNRTKKHTATATSTAPVAPAVDLTGAWLVDPAHSAVGFSARHAMVTKVRGQFTEFDGRATIDSRNPAGSTVTVVIQAASIDTRQADRDAHLRSADFFDVETHPEIRFVSTRVARKDAQTWSISGDLTIKGVTKPVTVDFEYTGSATDPFGNKRAGFEGSVVVNRKDWGLTWNAALETGGLLVSEDVTLEFAVSAIATAPVEA